jgi:electron transfer flavoprotein alpha subunit
MKEREMSILVWVEQMEGVAVSSSLEVLGKGRELADELGVPLIALVMGEATETAAHETLRRGADTALTVTSSILGYYRLSIFADVVKSAVAETDATIVLTSASQRGREVSAAVACELNAGLAPDAVDLRIEDGKLVAVRAVYSGNILADITFNSDIQVASVRPRSFPVPDAGDTTGEEKELAVDLNEEDIPEKVVSVESTAGGEIALTDARKIVSGGRGVAKDPELGFQLVADLAQVLDAAMGASRAAVDAGYIPYKHQVGQTGKTVSPDLYIAAGISGAIQHLAGMGSSKLIVAINTDADAPIFDRAHYGIVGDLYEVLPALTEEFRKRLG